MNTCETCGITSLDVELYKRVDGEWAYGCPSTDVGCYERWLVISKRWRTRSSRPLRGGVPRLTHGEQET